MQTLIKCLEIYACLFIVISTHELGHFLALRLCKARVARLTIFYLSIIRIWHGNTFYSVGLIPGGFTESPDFNKLSICRRCACLLGGIAANGIVFYALSMVLVWHSTQFMCYLHTVYGFNLIISLVPIGRNDINKVIKLLKSDDYK